VAMNSQRLVQSTEDTGQRAFAFADQQITHG
jgi:hypothetical protein